MKASKNSSIYDGAFLSWFAACRNKNDCVGDRLDPRQDSDCRVRLDFLSRQQARSIHDSRPHVLPYKILQFARLDSMRRTLLNQDGSFPRRVPAGHCEPVAATPRRPKLQAVKENILEHFADDATRSFSFPLPRSMRETARHLPETARYNPRSCRPR